MLLQALRLPCKSHIDLAQPPWLELENGGHWSFRGGRYVNYTTKAKFCFKFTQPFVVQWEKFNEWPHHPPTCHKLLDILTRSYQVSKFSIPMVANSTHGSSGQTSPHHIHKSQVSWFMEPMIMASMNHGIHKIMLGSQECFGMRFLPTTV